MSLSFILSVLLAQLLTGGTSRAAASDIKHVKENGTSLPNIIIFFIDDMGYGDLSPYGHPTTNSPHIQRLADEGLLFTQFYTSSPVCTPSRSALLTGRYQVRSGIYPGVFDPDDLGGLPKTEITIAEGLKKKGYSTGMVGKWHLGVGANGTHLPNNHGFDYYMGLPYTHDACPCFTCFYPNQACVDTFGCNPQYVPCPVYESTYDEKKIIQQPADLTTLSANLANAAVSFIQQKASNQEIFFLYYAFQHTHYPQFSGEKFRNSSKRGELGDSIREVDWAVGQVMQALRNAGIYDNTFVFLTADNGPDLSQGPLGGSQGLLRCGKASTWDGGMRVPAIAWWPSKIRHGRTHKLAATLDLLPTLFTITGASWPEDYVLDGVDMSDVLFYRKGKTKREWFAYFPEFANETQGPFAIRWKQYKAHYYTQGGLCSNDYPDEVCRSNTTLRYHDPPLLYNLHNDPGEINLLDPDQYKNEIQAISQIRKGFLDNLEWAEPQMLVGKDDSAQPCALPGCQPFPFCCRTNELGHTQEQQTLAWL